MPPISPALTYDDALFAPAAKKMQANFEMLIGRPIAFESAKGAIVDTASLKTLLPMDAVMFRATITGGVTGCSFVVTNRTGALGLALLVQMVAEATISERLAAPDKISFTDGDSEALGEVGNFLMAGLSDVSRESCGSKLKFEIEPIQLDVGTDELAASTFIVSTGKIHVDGLFESPCVIALPTDAAAVMFPILAASELEPPEPEVSELVEPVRTSRPSEFRDGVSVDDVEVKAASILVIGGESAAIMVGRSVPEGYAAAPLPSMGDLVKLLDAGVTPALVAVEVVGGREWTIEIFGTLKRHPSFSKTRLIALLEAPTRGHVVRCAMAGFTAAFPTSAGEQSLKARLVALLPKPVARAAPL